MAAGDGTARLRGRVAELAGTALCAMPADLSAPDSGVFVVDSGLSCDQDNFVVPEYLETDTANATETCHNGKLYHLVYESNGKENSPVIND
jgi:hypothetical protein